MQDVQASCALYGLYGCGAGGLVLTLWLHIIYSVSVTKDFRFPELITRLLQTSVVDNDGFEEPNINTLVQCLCAILCSELLSYIIFL